MKLLTARIRRREKPERERSELFTLPVSLWVLGVFFGVSLVVGLSGYALLAVLDKSGSAPNENVYVSILGAVTYAIVILIGLGLPKLLRLWSGRTDYRQLIGLHRLLRWKDILYALAGFIVYAALAVILTSVVGALFTGYDPNGTQDLGFSKVLQPASAIIVFASLVLIAPIAEEIIFRGYLLGTLRRCSPLLAAAIITSIVFAVLHLFGSNRLQWNVAVDVFALSLVSSYLRALTGSLWASILLHMAKNALAFYVLYLAMR